MSIVYLLLGYFFLLMQGVFYSLMTAFAVPGNEVGDGFLYTLIAFMVGLPASCVVGAVLMTVGYFKGWEHVYVWLLLPIPFVVLFFIVVFLLPWQ